MDILFTFMIENDDKGVKHKLFLHEEPQLCSNTKK